MNSISRFKILIRYAVSQGYAESQKDLGRKLGYSSESAFSQVVNNKVQTPKELSTKLKFVIPELNTDWFETGEGEMLKPTTNSATIGTNNGLVSVGNTYNNNNGSNKATSATEEDIPEAEVAVIPTELYKDPNTNLYQYTEVNDVETQPIVHQFSPHDRFYRVINSSMSPKLLASDVVALQRVDIDDSIPGCVYMIDHRTKGSFLRKVTDQGETLLLTSYNKEDYPDFVVHKRDVLNLARVVGLIRTDI
jgi:phage repressor protein C with HTH and peptisase S24 domain